VEAAVSTRDEDIIIEVPGEDEASFRNIRDIIGQTARLEFKLLDDETDFFGPIAKSATPDSLPEGISFDRETVSLGVDENGEAKGKTNTYVFIKRSEKEQSKQTLTRLKEWIAGLDVPADREIGYELVYDKDPNATKEMEGRLPDLLPEEPRGDHRRSDPRRGCGARSEPGELRSVARRAHLHRPGRPYLRAHHRREHQATFRDHTSTIASRARLSSRRRSPAVHATITLGSSDPEVQLRDARKLELVLRSGALPAPITPSNEQHIGPSLGRDAIRLAVQGALAGSILVLAFMILYYHRAGIIADLAVAMNLFLQLAVLASFNASMTLPGIAGLALTHRQ